MSCTYALKKLTFEANDSQATLAERQVIDLTLALSSLGRGNKEWWLRRLRIPFFIFLSCKFLLIIPGKNYEDNTSNTHW